MRNRGPMDRELGACWLVTASNSATNSAGTRLRSSTGSSGKPLPGLETMLRPRPPPQRPDLPAPLVELAIPPSLPPCRRRCRRSSCRTGGAAFACDARRRPLCPSLREVRLLQRDLANGRVSPRWRTNATCSTSVTCVPNHAKRLGLGRSA